MSDSPENMEQIAYRAAGRSRQGGSSEVNSQYFCCMNFSGERNVRGIFGLADGSAGNADTGEASELAVQVFMREAGTLVEEGGLDGRGILEECVKRVHGELREEAGEYGEGETFAASFVFCLLENNIAHLAYAAGGVAYLIDGGRISRLTEALPAGDAEQAAMDAPAVGVLPAGTAAEGFAPKFMSQDLVAGSTLVICSDGVHSRVDNLAIRDLLKKGNTVEEGIDSILDEAQKRNSSEDVTVVAVSFDNGEGFVEEEEEAAAGGMGKIFAAVLVILVLVSAYLLIMRNRTAPGVEPEKAAVVEPAGSGADTEASMTLEKEEEPAGIISLQTTPEGAKIFINGVQEPGATPAEIKLDAGREFEIRVEARGYQPYVEKIELEDKMRLERVLTLAPLKPGNGSLLVICRPECSGMSMDGVSISGFPRSELLMREIPPGNHMLEAGIGDWVEHRQVEVVSGITQSVLFRKKETQARIFEGDGSEPEPEVVEVVETKTVRTEPVKLEPTQGMVRRAVPVRIPEDRQGSEASGVSGPAAPLVIRNENSGGGAAAEAEVKSEAPEKKAPKEKAQLLVITDVAKCNIMLLQSGRLVAAGFSGSIIEVEPGEYSVVAVRAGYLDGKADVSLDVGATSIEIEMIPRGE